MRKVIVFALVGALAIAIAAPQARAITLNQGDFEAHLNNASSLFAVDPGGGARIPRAPRDFLAVLTPDTSASIGVEPTPAGWGTLLDDGPVVGDEQRVIFELDQFNYADSSVAVPNGVLTGLLYDLVLLEITPVGASDLTLYWGALARNALSGVPAGLPAGTGGVVEVYEDTSPEAGGAAFYDPASDGLGPQKWVEASGAVGGRDAYPNVNITLGGVADPGSSLWLSAVLLPLGSTPVGGVPFIAKETLDLEEGSGNILTMAVKIIAGSAAGLFEKNLFGLNVDLLMRANLAFPSDGINGPLSAALPAFDLDAGNAAYQGDFPDVGNWQVESSDPIEGSIIPEPATLSLLGLSLLGLAGVRRRKKD